MWIPNTQKPVHVCLVSLFQGPALCEQMPDMDIREFSEMQIESYCIHYPVLSVLTETHCNALIPDQAFHTGCFFFAGFWYQMLQ